MDNSAVKNKESIGLIASSVLHLALLLFLVYLTFGKFTQPKQDSDLGLMIAFGTEDEFNIGNTAAEGNPDETVQETTTATNKKDNSTISSNTITNSNTEVKVKSKPSDASENGSGAQKKSTVETGNQGAELQEKKQKFGKLFGSGQGGKEGEGSKGDPDSKALEGISKGTGSIGGGLSGRKVVQTPTISEASQKYGRVIVKICVDKLGKVISSKFTQKGSTTTDSQLVKIAEKGATKYVFAPGELDNQCGTITFDFILN